MERHHRSIEGYVRTRRAQVREKYEVGLPTDHPIFELHGDFFRERFHTEQRRMEPRHSSGIRIGDHGGQMLPFGETVMWRDPKGSNYKFASALGFWIWFGREWHQARRFHGSNDPKASGFGEARRAAAACDARNTVVNENRLV